jgi:probable rRNA maturation factor
LSSTNREIWLQCLLRSKDLNILIFYDDISYRSRGGKKIKKLIENIVTSEKFVPGEINIIITSDKNLIKINRQFLKHNYYTDVISFSYNNKEIINGEVYLSLDTVKKNAINYNVSLNRELLRVIIHGILHLCGYEDDTEKKKQIMREKEDIWISTCYKR